MNLTRYGGVGVLLLVSCTTPASNPTKQPPAGAAGSTGSAGSAGPAGSAGSGASGATGSPGTGGTGGTSVAVAGSTGQSAGGAPASDGGLTGAGGSGADASTSASDGAIKQVPGKLTFRKIIIHETELAESASIGDFNRDGTADIVSGRRWYEGPEFKVAHIFRRGHEELPPEHPDNGVSDDWADYAYDVNADGWIDILMIASPDTTEKVGGNPIIGGEGYWYENPGATPSEMWKEHLISKDIRMEQRAFIDMNKDGFPDLLSGSINAGKTKGYYQVNRADVTAPWTFHTVTRAYDFYGNGWIHAIGAGDVDGNGTMDLLERAGYWLQGADGKFTFVNVAFSEPEALGTAGNVGGAHMFAYDVDGDGDADIITSLNSHGWGLAWFEQTAPGKFTKHLIVHTPQDAAQYNNIAFSQIHALVVEDMDGDGLKDIVTGKGWYVHPPVFNDPDYAGTPFLYVFRLVRDAQGAHYEPHLVDDKTGTGRQFQVGHLDKNGTLDIVIGGKKGLFVFLQDP
jgi:FG-GAP-like repeat